MAKRHGIAFGSLVALSLSLALALTLFSNNVSASGEDGGIEAQRIAAATPTVTLVGDSLVTQGINQYTGYLYNDASHSVFLNAKGGSPIAWGHDRLKVIPKAPVVIFALGTNETHEEGLTVDMVKQRIYAVLDTIGPNHKVLLYGVARKPGALPQARAERFKIVNTAYSEVAKERGPDVAWANWQSYINNNYGDSFPWHEDGLHYLQPDGYRIRAKHMAARLNYLGW